MLSSSPEERLNKLFKRINKTGTSLEEEIVNSFNGPRYFTLPDLPKSRDGKLHPMVARMYMSKEARIGEQTSFYFDPIDIAATNRLKDFMEKLDYKRLNIFKDMSSNLLKKFDKEKVDLLSNKNTRPAKNIAELIEAMGVRVKFGVMRDPETGEELKFDATMQQLWNRGNKLPFRAGGDLTVHKEYETAFKNGFKYATSEAYHKKLFVHELVHNVQNGIMPFENESFAAREDTEIIESSASGIENFFFSIGDKEQRIRRAALIGRNAFNYKDVKEHYEEYHKVPKGSLFVSEEGKDIVEGDIRDILSTLTDKRDGEHALYDSGILNRGNYLRDPQGKVQSRLSGLKLAEIEHPLKESYNIRKSNLLTETLETVQRGFSKLPHVSLGALLGSIRK